MALLIKSIPTFLIHVFAPVLGVCLAAWFVVLLVSAARGAPQTFGVRGAPQTFGARPRAPRGVVWAGLIALAVACTLYSGKSPNGTNGVQNLPPRPLPPPASLTAPAAIPSIFDYPRMITEARVASGIALVCVGTNETFTFDPPTGATVCEDWRMYGSASRWTHVSPTNFAFPFGGTNATTFTFLPDGVVYLAGGADAPRLMPFDAKMGIAPERYWESLGVTSRFWTATSPSNTFLATWQGALLGRRADCPVDVQVELFPDGGFIFRYDLSRCGALGERALPDGDGGGLGETALPNVRVGAWNAGGGEWYSVPHRNLTSARWRPVAPEDALNPDRDGDGAATVDELFFLGTDPGNPDSDFDGLSDGDEIAYGLNPLDPYSNGGPYPDGFAAKIGDLNPLACPQDSPYTFYEHVIYSGTTNGTVSVPESAASGAILEVSVSETGTGDLVVGTQSLPLAGGAPTVYVPVPRGSRLAVRLRRRTGSLSVSLDSGDFVIGEMPDLMDGDPSGWISFPRTAPVPEVACIHDLSKRKITVRIEPGYGEEGLSCNWWGTAAVAASNHADNLSATLTGNFDAHCTARVWYELVHPQRLFGERWFAQAVRFCPRPPDASDEPVDDPWDDPWYEPDPTAPGPYDDLYGGDGASPGTHPTPCDCCSSCPLKGGAGCVHHPPAPPEVSEPAQPDQSSPCPVHGCPYSECADLHGDGAPRAAWVPPSTHVLKIGRMPTVDEVALTVPEGAVNCCPCPDHWTNWVGVAHLPGHVAVKGGDGLDFWKSETDCSAYVVGTSPTRLSERASLAFATNGTIHIRRDYVVLGVDIDTPNHAAARLNALNPTFGVPVTVCTNVSRAARIDLVTRVRLVAGAVTLTAGGGAFKAWLDRSGSGDPPLLLVDGETRPTVTMSLAKWRALANLTGDEGEARTRVLLTSATLGARTLTFSFSAGGELNDAVVQRITFIDPLLLADTDGDWTLGSGDVADALAGRAFRFWKNEDRHKGDYVGQSSDISPNAGDLQVNGRLDLVNLFPVRVDLKPLVDAWGNATFRLRAPAGVLRFCRVDVPPDAAWSFQTNDVYTAPSGQRELVSAAHLTSVTPVGVEIVPSDILRAGNAPGVLAFEAAGDVSIWNSLELSVELDGTTLFSQNLPLSISSVRNMYRWRNIRGACGDLGGERDSVGEPSNRPDAECDGKHFVFVHGYNVNAAAARGWSDAMFKRLWLAGARSMFTAVDWFGDDSQFATLFNGDVTPDYYANVMHAFMSAPALTNVCVALPGEKVMLAHSLGNVLVSSAAVDCGLQYTRYYMLNAAVPMEAYDVAADAPEMLDSAWSGANISYRASDWSTLFTNTDFRASLSWRGRFAGIANAVNCYSETEDVLKDPELHGYGGAWSMQELLKGTAAWNALNAVPYYGRGVDCEGGWGVNTFYAVNPALYTPGYGFHSSAMGDITPKDAIEHPLFTPFRTEADSMHSTNLFTIADQSYRASLRAKFLGDAIPATSFAAGRNNIMGVSENYNMQIGVQGNIWPIARIKNNRREWLHSDVKNVAFFYLHQVFRKVQGTE